MNGKPGDFPLSDDESIRERVLADAADVAAPSESAEVRRAIARGDARYIAARQDAERFLKDLSDLGFSHQPVVLPAPPAAVRDRLVERARSHSSHLGVTRLSSTSRLPGGWILAMAASVLILITTVVGLLIERYAREARMTSLIDQLSSIRRQAAEADERLARSNAVLGADQLKLVSLASDDKRPARGRVFWDLVKNRWHFFAFDLAPPPAGRTYQLWFISKDGAKLPAGTFAVDAGGSGSVVTPVPQSVSPIALAAVTDEPIGGSLSPTGKIVLKGEVNGK